MLLACNYSDELIELLKEDIVNVDYIKLGLFEMYKDVWEKALSIKPILLHGLGFNERASMKNINDVNWEYVNSSIYKYKSPHYAIHLASILKDWDYNCKEQSMIEHMINVVKVWSTNIEVPFLIENMPYSLFDEQEFGMMKFCTSTDVINQVLDKTNAKLLLDIAHAKVTATNCHESVYDYLNRLPLEKVKEIHIVGTAEKENVELRDWHLEMKEEDYEILQWVLSKTKPDIVTLEYGGPGEVFSWRSDKEALKRQLIRLMEICNSLT